jgi:hypothetical protein
MEGRIEFIAHRHKQIMLIDFSGCTSQQIIELVVEAEAQIAEHPTSSVLTLADFTNAQVDKTAATRIKEALVLDRPYVKRSAWVGTDSLPHVFYEHFKTFSRREFPTFRTREEAMDWLVNQE